MKLSAKIILSFLLASLIPTAIAGWLTYNSTLNTIRQQAFQEKNSLLANKAKLIHTYLENHISRLEMINYFPPIQGIIRATPTGIDPLDQSTLALWHTRLATIFSSIIQLSPDTFQLRYLDKAGTEVVRVEMSGEMTSVTPKERLQNKYHRPYFQSILNTQPGETYVSTIELNEEYGKIQVPHTPVLRIGLPIYSETDQSFQGALISNIFARKLLELINPNHQMNLSLLDQNGYFLYSPTTPENEFSSVSLFEEQPELEQNLEQEAFRWHEDIEDQEVRLWRKIYYDTAHPDRYWILLERIPFSTLFAPLKKAQQSFIWIGFGTLSLVLLLSLIISRSISKPILTLNAEAKRIADGKMNTQTNPSIRKASDEIGELARSFDAMTDTLIELNTGLEHKVHLRTQELEKSEMDVANKNKELQTMLYITTHDLKEPLRAIENFSGIIVDDYASVLDEEGVGMLNRIVKASARMRLLLDDLMTLSRARIAEPSTKTVDLSEVVEDVLKQLSLPIHEKNAHVTVAKNLPSVHLDPLWATQAIYNLISNALKYHKAGVSPEVDITPYLGNAQDKYPNEIGIIISDRGTGIPPEQAENLFGLFKRGVSKKIEGTGAGLAIVRTIAERHEGHAWMEPRTEGGSHFILTFGMPQ